MISPAIDSALRGMLRYTRQVDEAAEQVARAGLETPVGTRTETGQAASGTDEPKLSRNQLLEGLVNMMLAQRLFFASLQTAQESDEMVQEAIDLAGHSSQDDQ